MERYKKKFEEASDIRVFIDHKQKKILNVEHNNHIEERWKSLIDILPIVEFAGSGGSLEMLSISVDEYDNYIHNKKYKVSKNMITTIKLL